MTPFLPFTGAPGRRGRTDIRRRRLRLRRQPPPAHPRLRLQGSCHGAAGPQHHRRRGEETGQTRPHQEEPAERPH